jgi:RNA polymerase subunit RPABC4/transcription elongation factor Spt4
VALKPCKECGREISTEAKACPHCGKTSPTGAKTSWLAAGCLIIIILFIVGIISISNDSTNGARSSSPTPSSRRELALQQVKLDFTWHKDGFENVMIATFTIKNPTTFTIKDIEITCEHSGPSGTKIDSNVRTIYEVFPPKKTRRIVDFNMGFIHSQATSSSCAITDLVAQ